MLIKKPEYNKVDQKVINFKIIWDLYYHKDRRDQENFGPYMRRKNNSLNKYCFYYSKATKLESSKLILKLGTAV